MGYVVLLETGKPARVVEHVGKLVQLEDLYRYTKCGCVDVRKMGVIPGSTRVADVWFDDEGLLNDALPNRVLGKDTVLCGDLVICANVDGESLPLTQAEAKTVQAFVTRAWPLAPDGTEKPEPRMTFIPIHEAVTKR